MDDKPETLSSSKLDKEKALDISVLSDVSDFQSLREEWQVLAKITDSTIYQTFEWNWIWWKHFGAGKKLHIIILREDDLLIGIIPLFWDTISLLNHSFYSCLRFIGSNVSQPRGKTLVGLQSYSTYMDVIIRTDYQKRGINNLISYFEQAGLPFHKIILDEVPENSCLWKYLLPALRRKKYLYVVEESSACPIIKLKCSWEEYQQNISRNQRRKNKKALHQIDKDGKKGFHIMGLDDVSEFNVSFDLLARLHQERWNKVGYPGNFIETRVYNFNKEVTKAFYKKGWIQIRMAKPVKRPKNVIAIYLFFDYKSRIYAVHGAMDFSSPFSKYGPGNVLLRFLIKKAVDEDKNIFDLHRGKQAYKLHMANTTITNGRITIKNPLKQTKASAKLARRYAVMKKKAKWKWIQFNLFMQGKTQEKGLIGYMKFLYERIKEKILDNSKSSG